MKKILLLAAAGLAVAGAVPAQRNALRSTPARTAPATTVREEPADSLWKLGNKAITDRDYRKAAELFKELVDKYPDAPRAGDALYWRGWAFFQMGLERRSKSDFDEAMKSIERFQASYAKTSAVTRDANDLQARIRAEQAKLGDRVAAGEIGENVRQLGTRGCPKDDDDIRMVALDAVMQMDAASALPILKQVLAKRESCSESLRKHAVFILSQKRVDEAMTLMLDVARSDPSSDVREEAIQWLGQSRSDRATAALDSVLFQTKDHDLRDKALFALSQQRTPRAVEAMRRFAEDERMPDDLRGQAVFWIGQGKLQDLTFFRDIFLKSKSKEIRDHVFQAVSQIRTPEASRWLMDIAKQKSVGAEDRKQAIFWASQNGRMDFDALSALYEQLKGEQEIQDQILFALSQRKEPAAVDKLIAIARTETNKELRNQAIFWLGQRKNDPKVQAFLLELLK